MDTPVEHACALYPDLEAPAFEDLYFPVALFKQEEREARSPFQCRVRRWDFGAENADKPVFLLISGIAHNCNFFTPLVKCMFAERAASRIYAIDLPGHGTSQIPPNIKFGMLRLDDYVDTLMQVMDQLTESENVKAFDYVVAHSMGGILAQLLEKKLRASNRTLKISYGTNGIVLLASSLPERIDWELGEGPNSEYGIPVELFKLLLPFVTFSPRYLLFGYIANEDWVKTFFGVANEAGEITLVPNAPTGDTLKAMNDVESYIALSELSGLDFEKHGKIKRPRIPKGIFEDYTFGVLSYSKDILFNPDEEEALCKYLSNGKGSYEGITHDYAVHDSPYSDSCNTFGFIQRVLFPKS